MEWREQEEEEEEDLRLQLREQWRPEAQRALIVEEVASEVEQGRWEVAREQEGLQMQADSLNGLDGWRHGVSILDGHERQ